MTGTAAAGDRQWSIRAAVGSDADALGRLHVHCWHETYRGLVPETLLARFSVQRSRAVWDRILRDHAAHDATAVYLLSSPASAPLSNDLRSNELLGFGSCGRQRTADLADSGFDAEVSSLYLLRSQQRQGLGNALLRALVDDLMSRGFKALSLWVLKDNAPARAFYERCGGLVIGEKRDVREDGTLIETAYGWPSLMALRDRLEVDQRFTQP